MSDTIDKSKYTPEQYAEQRKLRMQAPRRNDTLSYLNDLNKLANNGPIPSRDDPKVQESINTDKMSSSYKPGAGIIPKLIYAERQSLRDSLNESNRAEMSTIAKYIGYVPNSKWTYFNRLCRLMLSGSKISKCDVLLVERYWMKEEAKTAILDVLNKYVDTRFTGFSESQKAKSLRYTCLGDKIQMATTNPGDFDDEGNLLKDYSKGGCGCSNDEISGKIRTFGRAINDIQNEVMARHDIYNDTSILDEVEMNPKFKKLINYVRDNLYESHIDYDTFQRIAQAFEKINSMQRSKYLLSVMDPFVHRFSKMPGEVPIPSSSFSLRSNLNLTTNNLGNAAFYWQPFALFKATQGAYSSFAVCNDAYLTGLSNNGNSAFIHVDIGQNLPADLYSKYRLVSAAVKLTFTSSQLNSTGFGTIAVDFAETQSYSIGSSVNTKYSTFNSIENGYFKQNLATRGSDSFQCNYIPLDSSFTEYQNVGTSKSGFVICGYVSGAPISTTVARIDIVSNYEAIVDVAYTDYLPCQVYTGETTELKTVNRAVIEIQNVGGDLSPTTIQKSITANNPELVPSGNTVIQLPPSAEKYKNAKQQINDLDMLKQIMADRMTEKVDKYKKDSILGKVADIIAPAASNLIATQMNKIFGGIGTVFGSGKLY